jgi:hypothetical protein
MVTKGVGGRSNASLPLVTSIMDSLLQSEVVGDSCSRETKPRIFRSPSIHPNTEKEKPARGRAGSEKNSSLPPIN